MVNAVEAFEKSKSASIVSCLLAIAWWMSFIILIRVAVLLWCERKPDWKLFDSWKYNLILVVDGQSIQKHNLGPVNIFPAMKPLTLPTICNLAATASWKYLDPIFSAFLERHYKISFQHNSTVSSGVLIKQN